ncbi:unnamed protein product [Clavelina lepadiformis]|uniref:Uncharacterized protein n=1 Tax=Clavelina lepadiformis TaxID=159417 RepID=A0ABP0GC50_CLALP
MDKNASASKKDSKLLLQKFPKSVEVSKWNVEDKENQRPRSRLINTNEQLLRAFSDLSCKRAIKIPASFLERPSQSSDPALPASEEKQNFADESSF